MQTASWLGFSDLFNWKDPNLHKIATLLIGRILYTWSPLDSTHSWTNLGSQRGKKALSRARLVSASWQGFEKGHQSKRVWTIFRKFSKTNEDLSEFLERIYQTYRHHTNTDPENIRMANLTFWGKVPQISGESYLMLELSFPRVNSNLYLESRHHFSLTGLSF